MTWRSLDPDGRRAGPRPVSDSLGGVAASLGVPRPSVLAAVFAHWEAAVGPDIAAHARPVSLRDGVLVVVVDQPAWATHLNYLHADLLARLSEAAGPGEVQEVRIRVGAPAEGRRARRPTR